MNCVVVLFATFIGLAYASDVKRYELFTASDKTKWIQVSQVSKKQNYITLNTEIIKIVYMYFDRPVQVVPNFFKT